MFRSIARNATKITALIVAVIFIVARLLTVVAGCNGYDEATGLLYCMVVVVTAIPITVVVHCFKLNRPDIGTVERCNRGCLFGLYVTK